MANIIRCKLPDGVHRFKPFTVADYRDFLLVRNDMDNHSEEEQHNIMNEMLEDYFGEFPESWRPYIFVQVYTSSIGKTKIPVVYECSTCSKTKQALFNLHQKDLSAPSITTAGVKIEFDFPSRFYEDKTEMILQTIRTVSDDENKYEWDSLDDETQLQIIDSIDLKTFEELIKKMKPFHFELKYGCCSKHIAVYDNLVDLFKILLNPSEVFSFYQINHLLVKSHYTLDSIMSMIPIERNIALSLVEKDLK